MNDEETTARLDQPEEDSPEWGIWTPADGPEPFEFRDGTFAPTRSEALAYARERFGPTAFVTPEEITPHDIPNTPLWMRMAQGHYNRTGHPFRAHLEYPDELVIHVRVYDCCTPEEGNK